MSRATHDAECRSCGFKGKVNDEAINCPECGQSIEGVAITGEALEVMLERIKARHTTTNSELPQSKETKN